MRYRNNLTDVNTNTFFFVVEPFDVYVEEAIFPSNTYFGSSQALGIGWRRTTLESGTEIHDITGGLFVVLDGHRRHVRHSLNVRHPFERGANTDDTWPLDLLEFLPHSDKPDIAPVFKAPRLAERPAGEAVGRNIDIILEEP